MEAEVEGVERIPRIRRGRHGGECGCVPLSGRGVSIAEPRFHTPSSASVMKALLGSGRYSANGPQGVKPERA